MRLSATDQLLLLLYADDIVLVAKSLDDLQRMSDILAQHARQWRYEVNLDQSIYWYIHSASLSFSICIQSIFHNTAHLYANMPITAYCD